MSFWGRMRVFVLVSLPVWLPLWHPWVLFFDRIFPFDLKISCYPAGWLLTLGFTSPKIQVVWLLACAMGIWIKRLRKRNYHRTLFWKSIIMGIFKKTCGLGLMIISYMETAHITLWSLSISMQKIWSQPSFVGFSRHFWRQNMIGQILGAKKPPWQCAPRSWEETTNSNAATKNAKSFYIAKYAQIIPIHKSTMYPAPCRSFFPEPLESPWWS